MDFSTRLLTESDVPQILKVQSVCFPEVEPESAQSFINKIQASPKSCWGLFENDRLTAYLISLPWYRGKPLALNQLDVSCNDGNCLYLHDLALLPVMRGTGAAAELLSHFFEYLNGTDFTIAALVAIQGSVPFWQKQGFAVCAATNDIREKLESYGTDSAYMEYTVET